jgi:hypothetical protein
MEIIKNEEIKIVVYRIDSSKTYTDSSIECLAAKVAADDEGILGKLFDTLNFSADMRPDQFKKIISRDFVAFMDELEDIVDDWKRLNKKLARDIRESLK